MKMTHTALLKRFNELAAKATPGKWKASATAQKQSNYGKYKAGLHRGEGMKLEHVTVTADTPVMALQIAHNAANVSDLLSLANAQAADIAELVACLRWHHINFDYEPCVSHREKECKALLERIGHE